VQEARLAGKVEGIRGTVKLLGGNMAPRSTPFIVFSLYSGGTIFSRLHELNFATRVHCLLSILRTCAALTIGALFMPISKKIMSSCMAIHPLITLWVISVVRILERGSVTLQSNPTTQRTIGWRLRITRTR
jgi:hypothetical protein